MKPNTIVGYQEVQINKGAASDPLPCDAVGTWEMNITPPPTPTVGELCYVDPMTAVGRCAQSSCAGVDCGQGFVCFGGSCPVQCTAPDFSPDAACLASEVCFKGRCADAADPWCDGVVCPQGADVCYRGECFPACGGVEPPCGAGYSCYQGRCAPDNCAGVAPLCLADESCYQGTCFQDCDTIADCTRGGACFEDGAAVLDGRCANDSCAALATSYDATALVRSFGRMPFAQQLRSPFLHPAPLDGTPHGPVANFMNVVANDSVTTPNIHKVGAARFFLYYDATRSRYLVYLTQGSTIGGQTAGQVTYTITHSAPTFWQPDDKRLRTFIVGDRDYAWRRVTNSNRWVWTITLTNPANGTASIAIGDLPPLEDWRIEVTATMSGGITDWEYLNGETFLAAPLDSSETLIVENKPIGGGVTLVEDYGMPCTAPGVGACSDGFLNGCNMGWVDCAATWVRRSSSDATVGMITATDWSTTRCR